MRILFVGLTTMVLAATGCSAVKNAAKNERAVSQDFIVANAMCAPHGTSAATNDRPGDRMVCQFEEPIGSHVSKCVCHDEKQLAADRELAQQWFRDAEHGRCISNGGGECH
jgi:hypothetical protein